MCRATASPSEQVSSVPDRVGQETSIPSISGAIECDSSRTTGSNATCGAVALFERSRLPKSLYVRCELLSSKAALLNGMTNTENNPQNGSKERAVVYVRVSSKKQAEEGVSIAAQTEKGKAYATIMEFAVSDEDVFVDDGVSASIHLWDRPAGKALKSHIHAEGIRHIIAVKIDRLFRDVPDLLTTVDELRKEEIDLHLLEYNGATLDTSSAMGRFFLTVIGGIAELERNSNLSLRLDDLRRSAMGASDQQRDMRKIASKWIEYCRNNKEVLELNKKTRGRKKKGKMEEALVSNPPTDFEEFLGQFENIECIPDIETRVIAMIAGIPNPRGN